MRKELGAAVLGAAALFGGSAVLESPAPAQARVSVDSPAGGGFEPIRERTVKCSPKADKWVTLVQGDRITLTANAAVIPSDASVGKVPQYDGDADTATTIAIDSKDGDPKKWTIDANFGGSMHVLPCDSTRKEFYEEIGRQATILDRKQGKNNPVGRVNFNLVEK